MSQTLNISVIQTLTFSRIYLESCKAYPIGYIIKQIQTFPLFKQNDTYLQFHFGTFVVMVPDFVVVGNFLTMGKIWAVRTSYRWTLGRHYTILYTYRKENQKRSNNYTTFVKTVFQKRFTKLIYKYIKIHSATFSKIKLPKWSGRCSVITADS